MKFSDVITDAFSTAEAARLSGLTPRQLDHWDRLGFLKPSLEPAKGYGSRRRYAFADLVRLKVAARLRSSGVGLARIRRCVEALKRLGEEGETDLAQARLIVIGNRVLWAKSDREVVDLLKEGQLVLVFSLGEAVEETAGAAARLHRETRDLDEESGPEAERKSRPRRLRQEETSSLRKFQGVQLLKKYEISEESEDEALPLAVPIPVPARRMHAICVRPASGGWPQRAAAAWPPDSGSILRGLPPPTRAQCKELRSSAE